MAEKVARKKTARKVAKRSVARKAPTNIQSESPRTLRSYLSYIAIGVFIVIVGGSIAVGYMDQGVIDVSGTITERKNNATPEELEEIQNVPTQQAKPRLRDGGLVPTTNVDRSVLNASQQPQSEEIASTTEESASSTQDTAEDSEVETEASEETDATAEPAAGETTEPEATTNEGTEGEESEV